MNVIRVRKHIDSETLHLPELRPMVGHDVQIIVLDENDPLMKAANEFWNPPTLEELVARQGVAPINSVKDLQGSYSDEDFEGFDEFIANLRRGAPRGVDS